MGCPITPSNKRRATRGSGVGECRFRHTVASNQHEAALRAMWDLTKSETNRSALELAYLVATNAPRADIAAVLARIAALHKEPTP